ncbi:2'-5' RNA ligase family protein [Kitasatospora sp. NPDC088783]|uniref:2'-5' RNA ligase family protein n=1 Tax=Kitasatospora sp. NPDC088783 TaxID=3364077 RepID=UPI0038119B3F
MDQLIPDTNSFPADPPSDLDDALAITDHDWGAFSALTRMKNHWNRTGWEDPNRRVLYWLLTFAGQPDLLDLVQRCQQPLEPLGLDLIAADGLHVTMVRVGDRHLVSPSRAQDLVRAVDDMGLPAFTVHAHPLTGSRGAVRFSLSPWTPLVRLHTALTLVGSSHGVPGGSDTSSFRPHLGVAYNPCGRDARPVIDTVAPLRRLPPVALRVGSVDLVELRREGRSYRWETLAKVALAGSA